MGADNQPDYEPPFAEQARKLCKLGASDRELADFFNVSVRTIARWQTEHAPFQRALKLGKAAADDRVERTLFHKAIGYSFEAEKIFQYQGQPVRVTYREHLPPDTTAMMFWLKNRRPGAWREAKDHEISGQDGTPLVPVLNVTIGTDSESAPEAGQGTLEPGD